jgi:eukaryotic-like serine/threonine-protein kinase
MLHSDQRIVRLLDVEEKTAPPYFVMDYAERGSLAARLALGPIPAAEALPLFRQVVEAMAYVHAKGIRHCDLKPGNILLDAAGRPKVADFGQAQLSIESTPAALGTFFYMAPEQATTEKQIPDTRWDVFGLGALLFAMLTGKPPRFDQQFKQELENTAELSHRLDRYRRRVQTTPAPTEHRQVSGVDRPLSDIIDRCLAINPAQRLRDAGDVLAALDKRERRRRLRPLLVFALVAPMLLMGTVGLFGYLLVEFAANDTEVTLTKHLLDSDQITASLVANVVKEKLDNAVDKLQKFATSDNMRKNVLAYLDAPTPKNRVLLEDYLARVGTFESKHFYSFTVFDGDGKLLSIYLRRPHDPGKPWEKHARAIYDKDFSWRDYFNRRRDYYEEARSHAKKFPYEPNLQGGVDVPYISQPFMSRTTEGFLCIGISAPIYADKDSRKRVGLLLGTINLRDLERWIKPVEDNNGCAVLLDERGFCLHHLEKHRKKLEPKLEEAPPRWQDKSPVFQAVLGGQSGQVANYVDPIDGRAFLAAHVPVPVYGWGVLVQHDRAGALAHLADVGRELTGFVWLAGGISGILLSAFWGWLLWVLRRKEEGLAHG